MAEKMAMNGAAPVLPEEIITTILKMLPVKSLMRFQCVSKHWKNLFKNPAFIADHLRHSGHHNPYFLFFHTFYQGRDNPVQLNLLDCEMHIRDLQRAPAFDSLLVGLVNIIGSSNGLLCVTIRKNGLAGPPSSILLWNPATRDLREVPRSKTIDSCWIDCVLGFGFNSSLNDFKIVAIADQIDRRMGVYSLSRDSWKEIELKNLPEHFNFVGETAISSNEAIFWKGLRGGKEREEEGVIVSFDTGKEMFTFMPLPTATDLGDLGNLKSVFVNLTMYNGKLAILYSGSDASSYVSYVCLWVMEEDVGPSRERWSWTMKFIGGPFPCKLSYGGTIWRNEIVMAGYERQKEGLCLVNFTTNEFKMLYISRDSPSVFLNYVESLVPVVNFHNVEEPPF